ncbi:putative helicase C15C4.05 [Grifola frondosa]|uniref:RNA helicase n=1 Tax=Grifola frondosa TaxID=5627 RepID=A0A1C7MUW5_GRIFR|nr:putative helicase C15C4.05 [Grifola frondosa]
MAKKKKTQLKPVVRGFATKSVPKKVVEVPEVVDEGDAAGSTSDAIVDDAKPLSSAQETIPGADDPLNLALQGLIDKFQDKTEKEIARNVKTIEQERRFSQSLPRLDLNVLFVNRILQLIVESENTEVPRTVDEPEEKAIARLATTYGVLRRLGFSESRVEECLRAIQGVDLDEAFEWLHVHCLEEELGFSKDIVEPSASSGFQTPQTPRSSLPPQTPLTPHTPTQSQISIPSSPSSYVLSTRLDAKAAAFVPGVKPGQSAPRLSALVPLDDPIAEFVRLKMEITDRTERRRHRGGNADAVFLKSLQKRLEDIRHDYFFDEEEAETHYRVERDKSDAFALQSKLRGDLTPPASDRTRGELQEQQQPPSTIFAPDIFEEGDDDSSGGMFDILEMPTTETTESGITIQIRDMALPKHWSGQTPKSLLSESVRKVDRYAAISYSCVSGSSRAKRAAVEVRWEGSRKGEWVMNDVACYDMSQAEQYVATVALHSLTFPSLEGFALGGTMAAGSQTSFRLLPGIYRDLWDELEKKRRLDDDAINRSIWGKLRSILEPKLIRDGKTNSKTVKQSSIAQDLPTVRTPKVNDDLAPEQVVAGFMARQASPSYQEMLRQRNQLPIARYREDIISLLEMSQVLVLSGETGCGKSTQVPAFILEDQLSKGRNCKIYCTEPRRISAISLAQRVSRELGEPAGAVGTLNSLVGYSIRLESNITRRTRLAFVTNGIALRMLEGGSGQGGQGTAFDEITHIIIDEVHERTIESDFLLIVLKSLMLQRPDLKIVLMSATVDAEKISNYFGGCPILFVPGRTFPVDVRYLEDAVEFTQWKISESSLTLGVSAAGKDKFYRGKARLDWSEDTAAGDDDDDETVQENVKLEKRYSPSTVSTINLLDERIVPYDLIVRLLERICFEDPDYIGYSPAILIFMPGMGEIRRLNDTLMEHPCFGSEDQFRIYPLHSTISSEQQGAVFDIPPPGKRKIVIATNIAETGITIPDITCVIDVGKHREMRFDEKRQISRLVETFVAKSNAAQRRGRAGRVQSGLCFHLFTKIRHDTKMAQHPDPEMLRLSLSDLALRIKIMKVNLGTSIEDVLSKALDPPLAVNVQRAISALVEVRALTSSEDITPMGRLLSQLPTDVHLGKFLLIATLFRCLDPALTIAATLNSKSPFLSPLGLEQEAERAKSSFRIENSDFLTIHNAFASWRRACANGIARKFCKTNYLSHQNLQQIEELRQQFLGYLVDSSFIQVDRGFVRELSRARYGRGRPRFVDVPPELNFNSVNVALVNASLAAGLYPKILAIDPSNGGMRTITNNQAVSFHPSSVNFHMRPRDFGVNHLCYFTIMHSKKLYAWETGPVDDLALLLLCGDTEFKLMSNLAFIDRKIKFRIHPKASVALKFLRSQLGSLLAIQFRNKPLTESQLLWNDTAMMVLGKMRPDDEDEYQESITVVINQ